MNWVLIVWLSTPNNFTVFDRFSTIEDCLAKKEIVIKALSQAESKMNVDCRKRKIGDLTNKSDIMVKRYVLH